MHPGRRMQDPESRSTPRRPSTLRGVGPQAATGLLQGAAGALPGVFPLPDGRGI